MKLAELASTGALVEHSKEQKTVTWTALDGNEYSGEVTVKVLAFGVVEKMVNYALEQGTTASVALIMAAVEFEGGDTLSLELAENLDPGFARALVEAINEVNPTKKPTTPEQ